MVLHGEYMEFPVCCVKETPWWVNTVFEITTPTSSVYNPRTANIDVLIYPTRKNAQSIPLSSDFLLQMHLILVLQPALEVQYGNRILRNRFYSLDTYPKVSCLCGTNLCQGQKCGALLNVRKCFSNCKLAKDDIPHFYQSAKNSLDEHRHWEW